jgi:hypothetical protein
LEFLAQLDLLDRGARHQVRTAGIESNRHDGSVRSYRRGPCIGCRRTRVVSGDRTVRKNISGGAGESLDMVSEADLWDVKDWR